jgi:VWFA-related protein
MRRRNGFVVAAIMLAAGNGLASAPPAPLKQGSSQVRPTFRSGVDLVTVDVAVVNAAGEPVRGLTAGDFELRVDGAAREVVWAEFIRRDGAPLVSASSDHYSTNEGGRSGRLVAVVVDQAHIRRVEGRAALRAAAAFIDSLDRDDRVAAVSLNVTERLEFTSEHAVVKRQLERLSGTATQAPAFHNIGLTEALAISEGSRIVLEQVVRRECGAPLSQLTDVRRLAERTGTMDPCPAQVELEGRSIAQQVRSDARISLNALRQLIARLGEIEGPKTIVLVSEGLTAEPQLFDLTPLGTAAHDAQVTVYVLQLETPIIDAADARVSPTVQADISLRGDGLARLAGSARGAMFRLVGADPQPFRRIVSELSAHYVLAFQPLPADRQVGTRSLDVKVPNRRAIVRARPSFTIPAPLTLKTTEAELVRLLRDPRPVAELPLRVATYSFLQPGGSGTRTIVAAETALDTDVTLGYLIVNSQGVIAASGSEVVGGGRFVATSDIPDGRYLLKIAILDRAGRRGSVERQFEVKLGKPGGVSLGDLMVAEPGSAGRAALQPVVASLRGSELVVYTELYSPGPWTTPGVLTIELDAGEGAPVRITPVIERAGADRWTVTGRIPLADVRTGPRVVTMTIAAPGAEPVRRTRAFAMDRR